MYSPHIDKIKWCNEDKEYQDALLFFYDVNTIDELESIIRQGTHLNNYKKGERGEKEVNYSLKWLPSCYQKIEPYFIEKYQDNRIILMNKNYINESQEYDHIVVGPQGVFVIETKNYKGKLIIDDDGNWIRDKENGEQEGERNPLEQIRRHEKLLRSIVGNIDVISIICLSHPKVIIEGAKNCPVKIIKSDLLCEYIENYKGDKKYNDDEIKEITYKIQQYQIK